MFVDPLLTPIFGDEAVTACFSAEAVLARMIRFESALAWALADCDLLPSSAAEAIEQGLADFVPDRAALAQAVARDGLVVPGLVAQMKAHLGTLPGLHRGATSQDLIDTALVQGLLAVVELLATRLQAIAANLKALEAGFGARPLMGQTRMQAALPITVADRLRVWAQLVDNQQARLHMLRPQLAVVQFGGAVGDRRDLNGKGDAVAAALAARLGLASAPVWHAARDGMVTAAQVLALITGSLGKIGQDIALMAQNERGELRLRGGGGSSAMPHKQNPIRAEALVTLARYNAVQISGMHQAMVHEQERSGAAWALEWLILPAMAVAAGAATRLGLALLMDVEAIGAENGRHQKP